MNQFVHLEADDFVSARKGNRVEDYSEEVARATAMEYFETQERCDELAREQGGLTALTIEEASALIRQVLIERYEAEIERRKVAGSAP